MASERSRVAMRSVGKESKDVRFDFARGNPDIVQYMVALRTELLMRMVLPTTVPHDAAKKVLSMVRFEWGQSGNPHGHGFSVGDGNPVLPKEIRADFPDGGAGEVPVRLEEIIGPARASEEEGGGEDGADDGETRPSLLICIVNMRISKKCENKSCSLVSVLRGLGLPLRYRCTARGS